MHRLFHLSFALLAHTAYPVSADPDHTDCVFNPTQPSCVDYRLDHVKARVMVEDACQEVPEAT
ncbi:hypothetical protein HK102_011955, partial [Quaeritorhiza haematococci]